MSFIGFQSDYNVIKRILDLIISSVSIIILFPLLLAIILLLLFANQGAGVFFFQTRIGKNSKPFKIWKFKTMTEKKDDYGHFLPDHERLTRIGNFVRAASIDELPQLFNVIFGDMSIVGPRPLLEKYLILYSKEQNRRHQVKPGITGWAQVNGRNSISWKEKFEFDVYYVDNYSFLMDLKIIYLTIKKVIKRADINKEGHATTEAFNGKN
jgi:undecaprenyl phosphate N,N'-diacetylbacillosamine 1-phosphate transferase